MNRTCTKRLQKELQQSGAQSDETIKLSADPTDIKKWTAIM